MKWFYIYMYVKYNITCICALFHYFLRKKSIGVKLLDECGHLFSDF